MGWNARFAKIICKSFCLIALGNAYAGEAAPGKEIDATQPMEMSFMKGDTRNGSKIHLRIVGDSLYYSEVAYRPDAGPLETRKALLLGGNRRKALNGVLGELQRYSPFGTCFGRDMRFYMVETAAGKFYRSLPERSGKCYTDEPGIWSLFQDLDDLLTPPDDSDYQEYSAS